MPYSRYCKNNCENFSTERTRRSAKGSKGSHCDKRHVINKQLTHPMPDLGWTARFRFTSLTRNTTSCHLIISSQETLSGSARLPYCCENAVNLCFMVMISTHGTEISPCQLKAEAKSKAAYRRDLSYILSNQKQQCLKNIPSGWVNFTVLSYIISTVMLVD